MEELRCALELRADDSRQSPGRLYGVLLEYEKRAVDRPELFGMGALYWPRMGIILNLSHDRAQPLMRVTPELRGALVVVDEALPDTSRGRDAAVMVRDGTFRGLSAEFYAEREGRRGQLREIQRARLSAIGLVDDPAYGGSVEVRRGATLLPVDLRERLLRWL